MMFFWGVWDAEAGGRKTGSESAGLHSFEINTAFGLYNYLKQQHSTVTNSYHKVLHQVDKHKFHYFAGEQTVYKYHEALHRVNN